MKSRVISFLVLSLLSAAAPVGGDTVRFREGGGPGYVDLTFDQTDINPGNDNVGLCTHFYTRASEPDYTLIGVKGLLAGLPLPNGQYVTGATLTVFPYWGDDDYVTVYRCLTDWLGRPAGQNQCNVTGQHCDLAAGTPWVSGSFSTADYDVGGGVTLQWPSPCYRVPQSYDVTSMVKAIYDTGRNCGFVVSAAGGTSVLTYANSIDNLDTRPVLEITYDCGGQFMLTVNSGSGDGVYSPAAVVGISADPPPSGLSFEQWAGHVTTVADVHAAETTITMPSHHAELTAIYVPGLVHTLTVNSGTGGGAYVAGTVVGISADPPATGEVFNFWLGDTCGVWEVSDESTTITMPAQDVTVTATYRGQDDPVDWWPPFDQFCRDRFAAEIEPLTYEISGTELAFLPGGDWVYESETSACVGFETNLPAKTYVEYGTTTGYGSRVQVATDRYYYVHLAYLRNLQPDTTYHYRLVAEDERGNVVVSEDGTLTTATAPNVVYISGQSVLDQPGKTYLLTQDFTADYGTALKIVANDVTLDLGGHTVVYNNVDDPVLDDQYNSGSAQGVTCYYRSGVRVYNGVVVQGAGNNSASADARGFSPIFLQGSTGEIAGITAHWSGPQVSGIRLLYSNGMEAHHNVAVDHGGVILNRSVAPSAIVATANTHHNLVKRARQWGISPPDNSDIYNNEVYIQSRATNSYGIFGYRKSNCRFYGNRIFGTGYLVNGIGTVSNCTDVEVFDNLVHLRATKPIDCWGEYGPHSGAYCCRVTWGGDNIQYHDNVMVTYGRDGGMVRGTWFYTQASTTNLFFRDNVVKAVLENMASDIQGAIVVAGDGDWDVPPQVYENNRIISNFANVRLGESYGTGCNTRFYDNTFVREGPGRTDYRTIQCGYGGPTKNHEFYDSAFEGGASYDEYTFHGSGAADSEFYVGWTLTVETEPFADVTITDGDSTLVYEDQADGSGIAVARLIEYRQGYAGKSYHTPHTVTATKGAASDTLSVTMDAAKTIQIPLAGTFALTVDGGTGGGDYAAGEVVSIEAGPAPEGMQFWRWVGDTEGIADCQAQSTTLTMPDGDTEVTADYTFRGDRNRDGVVGQIDLDMVLGDWGRNVPPADARADVNGDGFVGQADLDAVLDDWGQGF